jgi:hypothetical protein
MASSPLLVKSQDGEFGLFVGASYYNGEFNPSKQIIPVAKPAAGIFYDAHLNSRYTFRTIGTYGKLAADDNLTDIGMNNFRDMSFEATVLDLSGQIMFNFLPFGNTFNVKHYTPYIFVGLSIFNVNPKVSALSSDTVITAYPKESSSDNVTSVAMPFGLGFKAIMGNFTFGLEWNFRKTWTDRIDGLENQYLTGNTYDDPIQYNQPQGYQRGIFNTNDWYSFIGLTVSFRPSPAKNACPTSY